MRWDLGNDKSKIITYFLFLYPFACKFSKADEKDELDENYGNSQSLKNLRWLTNFK